LRLICVASRPILLLAMRRQTVMNEPSYDLINPCACISKRMSNCVFATSHGNALEVEEHALGGGRAWW
jgi:hypothetical protein